jgi:hypothetical protein
MVTVLLACGGGTTAGQRDPRGVDGDGTAEETGGSETSSTPSPTSSTPQTGIQVEEVAPVCRPGTRWSAGTQAFSEATAAWGLTGVTGTRLSAVDWDGDTWPDLVVRSGRELRDDFAPGGVRGTWLLRNRRDGTFEDRTQQSGFRASRDGSALGRPGDVVSFGDLDNDGDLDAITAVVERPGVDAGGHAEVLFADGAGQFGFGPEATDLWTTGTDTPAAVTLVDVDRDGFLDVWMPRSAVDGSPVGSRLLEGDGAGMFRDRAVQHGILTASWVYTPVMNEGRAHPNAWSGAACDLDGDGDPELLTASYGRAPSLLWRAVGGGQYVNEAVVSGYAFDERQDWTDNESARCWCQLHPADDGCAGVPAPTRISCVADDDAFRWSHASDREPYRLGGNNAATVCGDVDSDGDLDLLTTAIVHWDVGSSSDPAELLLNDGAARFTRPGNEGTGLARVHTRSDWNEGILTAALFDFDNDGALDVWLGGSDYPGERGLLYHQDAPAHFEAVSLSDGVDHPRSHGIAVADFDRDGDLDVVLGHSLSRCAGDTETPCFPTAQVRLFENLVGQDGNYLTLSLSSVTGNRSAIGARVTVTTPAGTQVREVGGGHGHFGAQDDLAVTFGLGAACAADVTIRWPDAALTTETVHLEGNRRWRVVQGTSATVE